MSTGSSSLRRSALLALGAAVFAGVSLAQTPPTPGAAPTPASAAGAAAAPAAGPASTEGAAPGAPDGGKGAERPALTEAQRELANLIELPVMARELVAAGVAQREVHALLVSLKSHEVSGAAASRMLRSAARGDSKEAPKLADAIKAKVDEGLRGVELADAIHAAMGKGGRGRSEGEGGPKSGAPGHAEGAPDEAGKGHGKGGAEGGPPEGAGKGHGEGEGAKGEGGKGEGGKGEGGKGEGAKGGKGDEKSASRGKGGE
jgi:hypothetical protein